MNKNKNQKGFTLLELLIVIAIVGIISSISMPKMNNFIKRVAFNSLIEEYQNKIMEARSRAIADPLLKVGVYFTADGKQMVVFYDNGDTPNVYDPASDDLRAGMLTIPEDIKVNVPASGGWADRTLIFRGDGSALSGGNVEFTHASGKFKKTINVLASTGRIRVN